MIGEPPSLAAFFEIWRRNNGDFLQDEGDFGVRRLSYARTADLAVAFAARLRAAGIVPGDRIVIWSENRGEWIVALWGAILEGVVAVPIDFRSSGALVSRIGGIVEAKAVLTGESVPKESNFPFPVWPLTGLLNGVGGPGEFVPAVPEKLAEVLFTSGATGEPKGVTLTHRNILANLKPIDGGIEKYRKYIGYFSPIRFLNLLPLSHMFGQSMAAFIPAMISGTVIFQSGQNPQSVAGITKRRRVSVIVCVPQMLDLLRQFVLQVCPEAGEPRTRKKWYWAWWQYRRAHRLLGWKFWAFVVGAAPLDPSLEAFWRKLGFVVIQGYGLTETAPVATLNHPFETRQGSVGKPISGVEVKIAEDGEILLRGENVTPGYYGDTASLALDIDGWFHTGDIGSQDAEGRLSILGRKKEMIVLPDGLNVFPQDVERALLAVAGVREAAVVAAKCDGRENVHAVLVLADGIEAEAVLREANAALEPQQRVKGYSIWPQPALPRTSGTNKLKRGEVAGWVAGNTAATSAPPSSVEEILKKYAGGRAVGAETTIEELGLSSLDRIQLLMELETRTGSGIGEAQFAEARTIADLSRPAVFAEAPAAVQSSWNRGLLPRVARRIFQPLVLLPITRLFARIETAGVENVSGIDGPVIFASNHQSHFDLPSILWSLPGGWRYRVATAMSKEFFDPYFYPNRYPFSERFRSGVMYFLSSLLLNTFLLPQREAGARGALSYAGELASEGWSILIFPEGKRTEHGEVAPFQPGVGMLASRLRIPVLPVRLEGLERVLHRSAKFATPGPAKVTFGKPLRFDGDDYAAIAKQIQRAVDALGE